MLKYEDVKYIVEEVINNYWNSVNEKSRQFLFNDGHNIAFDVLENNSNIKTEEGFRQAYINYLEQFITGEDE